MSNTKLSSYCERAWLNGDDSPSTSSVVAYDGKSSWEGIENTTFLQIASCHEIVRLHQTDIDTTEDMIAKMKRLRDVVSRFIEYLMLKGSGE